MKLNSLSIIIPTHNEEGNIITCINKIPRLKWKTDIIIIDDGTDNTADLVRGLTKKKKNLIVLHFNKKLGQGGAILKGLEIAKGDVVVTLDADYTVDPSELKRIVSPIFNNEVDFVNTSRFIYPMEKGAMRFLNKIGNKIFSLLTSIILKEHFTDVFCGTRAFKCNTIENKLTEMEWPALDMVFAAKKNNLRIKEIPIHYKARKAGTSKVKIFKTGYFHLRDIINKTWKYHFNH